MRRSVASTRAARSVRLYIALGVAIGACSSLAVRWALVVNAVRVFDPPHPVSYFEKGEAGYLSDKYCIDNSNRKECCSAYHCNMVVHRSTLYSECCNNMHVVNEEENRRQRSKILPLLITSAPRSGTRFIQQLFTMVGLDGLTNDERSPQHRGIVSWKHVFNDETYIVGNKRPTHLYKSKFRVIWHLVRDPLQALTSLSFTEPLLEDTDESVSYINYVSKHIQVSNQTELRQFLRITDEEWDQRTATNGTMSKRIHKFLIYRGMEIYLHWHGFINYLDVPIFRLEDLSEKKNVTVLDEVFYSVGLKPPPHQKVMSFLDAQEKKQEKEGHRRRLLAAGGGGNEGVRRKKRGKDRNVSSKQLHKNEREHRATLDWKELCHVNKRKAREVLKMSQSFGYYLDLDEDTLCPSSHS